MTMATLFASLPMALGVVAGEVSWKGSERALVKQTAIDFGLEHEYWFLNDLTLWHYEIVRKFSVTRSSGLLVQWHIKSHSTRNVAHPDGSDRIHSFNLTSTPVPASKRRISFDANYLSTDTR